MALSGDAFNIEGLPEVPDCLPSPMHGNSVIPCLINLSDGCIFTTSAEPGQPIGPAPLITRILFSFIFSDSSFTLS